MSPYILITLYAMASGAQLNARTPMPSLQACREQAVLLRRIEERDIPRGGPRILAMRCMPAEITMDLDPRVGPLGERH